MRARNIKPGFFKNDQLAACSTNARLLFIGLWCLADREGRCEDRPLRIKAEVFPFDNVDIETLLAELANAPSDGDPLVVRYEVDGRKYLYLPGLVKHQRFHTNEAQSVLPEPPRDTRRRTKATSMAHQGANHFALNDELGMMNDECGTMNDEAAEPPPEKPRRSVVCTKSQAEAIYSLYPRKVGKGAAVKAIQAAAGRLADDGYDDALSLIQAAVMAFAKSPAGQKPPDGANDYRPHPSTWFNQERYLDDPGEWVKANGVDAKEIAEQRKREERERQRRLADEAAGVTGNGQA